MATLGAGAYRALADVLDERRRQIEVWGFGPDHDDEHDYFELAAAAGCYVERASLPDDLREALKPRGAPRSWPWQALFWKPKDRRRDLVRAAALLIAEIERLDRKAP
jgi:hypothetical protein